MFSTYEKLIIYCFHCCTYVSSVMRYSWHFSTSGFNIRSPKKKLITNFHQITSIFYMLLEDSFGVKSISKFSWGALKHIYPPPPQCLWVLLTHVCWFRATGGYICGCGRPSNLVFQCWTLFFKVETMSFYNLKCYWSMLKFNFQNLKQGAYCQQF